MASGVRRMQLQENYIGAVFENEFGIKDGIDGEWRFRPIVADDVTQFRVIVDVPVPPERTTPNRYTNRRIECDEDVADGQKCVQQGARRGLIDTAYY